MYRKNDKLRASSNVDIANKHLTFAAMKQIYIKAFELTTVHTNASPKDQNSAWE